MHPPVDPHAVALVVGIDYTNGSAGRLEGAVNDARAFADLLIRRFGFDPARVQCLFDTDATRAAIEAGFRDHLAALARPDAPAVFYFAGHGTQVRSPHLRGEPDLYDEALVPVDRPPDPRAPSPDILDDTVRAWLDSVRATGASTIVVLDCCHSGTATRDGPTAGTVRRAPARPPPPPTPERRTAPTGPRGPITVLAAAADHQPAREAPRDGDWHGLMTAHLLDLVDRDEPPMTWQMLHDHLLARLAADGASQTPQLEGDGVDRVLFGDARRPLTGHHRLAHGPAGWHLDAGTLHGLAVGDRLPVFPLGGQTPSGEVEVRTAAACTCAVTPLDGHVPDVARVESKTARLPFELRLHLPGSMPADTRAEWLADDRIVEAPAEGADLALERCADGWRFTGAIVTPAPLPPEARTLPRLHAQLPRWAAWFGLHRRPRGTVGVDVRVRRRNDPTPARPDAPTLVSLGDIVIVKVTHHADRPMHVGVLELVDDGRIVTRRWEDSTEPGWRTQADQRVAPGRTIFFAYRVSAATAALARRSTFVAIATEEPADFGGLDQDTIRSETAPPALPECVTRQARPRGAKRPKSAPQWGIGRAVCATRRDP